MKTLATILLIATALAADGRREEARRETEAFLATHGAEPGAEEARELLESLGK